MSGMIFTSANYANDDNSAVIVMTPDRGAVAISQVDHHDDWDDLISSGIAIGPYMPPPHAVPLEISDRQFAQQLAILGAITEAEAIGWAARGDLPVAMETAISALPEGDRFAARMLLSSATTYQRAHPLVSALGGLLSYDAQAIDDIWRSAALL